MTDLDLNIILFVYSSQFVERDYLVMEGVKSLEFLFAWWRLHLAGEVRAVEFSGPRSARTSDAYQQMVILG